MVEPTRLALTITPSMGPSRSEETVPASGAGAWADARPMAKDAMSRVRQAARKSLVAARIAVLPVTAEIECNPDGAARHRGSGPAFRKRSMRATIAIAHARQGRWRTRDAGGPR